MNKKGNIDGADILEIIKVGIIVLISYILIRAIFFGGCHIHIGEC